MCRNCVIYMFSYIVASVLFLFLFPTLCLALEFTADDIQITGYDPASRYIGFILTDESGGSNEIWWVVELATGKAVNCYDIRRMSMEEGGMQAVYRTRAQQRFADLGLTAGTDLRTSMSGDELEVPGGRMLIKESKGGFAFTILYNIRDGGLMSMYEEDLTGMKHELGQPPGYYFAGGKAAPDNGWLATILAYENGAQGYLPNQRLIILKIKREK